MATLSPLQELRPQPRGAASPSRHLQWGPPARTAPVMDAPAPPDLWRDPARWNSERVSQRTVRLVGVGGFHALMVRAVALAQAEHGWLCDLRVDERGRLTDPGAVLAARMTGECEAACLAIRGHFRVLVARFLGADFAEKIIGGAWTDEPRAPAERCRAVHPAHAAGQSAAAL